uniref:Glycine-rich cell wall structural protein 2-like n=1 Tax=Elaeis guineensis var. tenera TaxID=51953 RepID=A0A6I9R1W4_ELAGV|nr:glycine-rich cell wall structural protein 2-like [Elaeis guineensis]
MGRRGGNGEGGRRGCEDSGSGMGDGRDGGFDVGDGRSGMVKEAWGLGHRVGGSNRLLTAWRWKNGGAGNKGSGSWGHGDGGSGVGMAAHGAGMGA